MLARGGDGRAQLKRRLARVRAPRGRAASETVPVNVRKAGAGGGEKGQGLEQWARRIVPHPDARGVAWNEYIEEVTLFDLKSDPSETKNLACDPTFAQEVSRLTRLLDNWWPVHR